MNLRTVISRPSRFDEEVFEKAVDPLCQKHMTKPAYPELLKSSTVAFKEPMRPAAFPSLDLRPHGSRRTKHKSRTFSSDGNVGHVGSKQLAFMKEEADLLDDPQTQTQGHVPDLILQGDADEIAENNVPVTWSMLSEALQLYIFESLLTQAPGVDTVIDMLGLDFLDARQIEALRNTKNIHPATTEQLLRHCSKISSADGQHIKPDILEAYMPYFTFAANFETATKHETMLGVQYLRDRSIEGDFVEALRSAINDNDVDAELSRTSGLGSGAGLSKQLISEWLARQPGMKVHESHDLISLAPSLICAYMPLPLRRHLLGKPQADLTPTERWLTHVNTATPLAGSDLIGTLTSARSLLSEWMGVHVVPEELNARLEAVSLDEVAAQEVICLFMHMLTAITAQTSLIEEQVSKMPLCMNDKVEVLRSARQQTERQSISDFAERLTKYMSSDLSLELDAYTDHSYDDVFDIGDEDSTRPTNVSARTSTEPWSSRSTPTSSTSHHYNEASRSGTHGSHSISSPISEIAEPPSAPSNYTKQVPAQYLTRDEVRAAGGAPISTPRSASPIPPPWSPLSENGQDIQSATQFSHSFQSLPHPTSHSFQQPHLSHVFHATPRQPFTQSEHDTGQQVPQSNIPQFPPHLLPSMSDLLMQQHILPKLSNSPSASQPLPQTTPAPLNTVAVAPPSGSKPRIRSPRKDKGKARGPYNTQKKKKANQAAQEAAARKRDVTP